MIREEEAALSTNTYQCHQTATKGIEKAPPMYNKDLTAKALRLEVENGIARSCCRHFSINGSSSFIAKRTYGADSFGVCLPSESWLSDYLPGYGD